MTSQASLGMTRAVAKRHVRLLASIDSHPDAIRAFIDA
jgi:hypothetical protein